METVTRLVSIFLLFPGTRDPSPLLVAHSVVYFIFPPIVWAVGRGHRDVYAAFGGFSISQLSISHTVVASGREASEKNRGKAWSRSMLGRGW